MAAGMLTHFQNECLKQPVIISGAEILHTPKKSGIFFGIFFLQEILQHISRNDLALGLVDLAESGVKIDIAEIIAQKKSTEAVDRGDLCIVEQYLLSLQMSITGIPAEPLRNCLPETLPHLGGSSSGKGHYQQPVDIKRMFALADQTDDPFDQDCGLAASGCRRDQYIVISRIQHFLLGGCKAD